MFEYLKSSIKVNDLNSPLTTEELQDQRSKTSSLIMYLLSIEPSITLEINRAIICFDMTRLMMLGPITRALFVIMSFAVNQSDD